MWIVVELGPSARRLKLQHRASHTAAAVRIPIMGRVRSTKPRHANQRVARTMVRTTEQARHSPVVLDLSALIIYLRDLFAFAVDTLAFTAHLGEMEKLNVK